MDAQEETSRIIIVIEDSGDNIEKAIKAVHKERTKIQPAIILKTPQTTQTSSGWKIDYN